MEPNLHEVWRSVRVFFLRTVLSVQINRWECSSLRKSIGLKLKSRTLKLMKNFGTVSSFRQLGSKNWSMEMAAAPHLRGNPRYQIGTCNRRTTGHPSGPFGTFLFQVGPSVGPQSRSQRLHSFWTAPRMQDLWDNQCRNVCRNADESKSDWLLKFTGRVYE